MTTASLPISAGGFFATSTDRGVGPDAETIRENLMGVLRSFYETSYMQEIHAAAREALRDAVLESTIDNWDGYGAKRVPHATYLNALWFLRSLPASIPSPSVSPDPDGEIAFEWRAGPDRAFSISVGTGDEAAFAWINGRRQRHGTELLIDGIPETVLQEMGRALVG